MVKFEFNLSPKTQPFPHQSEAINFIKGKEWVPLFDEQGLGKTKIIIDAILKDIESGFIDSALVICKKYLIPTWEEEILKHSHLKPIVLRGQKKELGLKYLTTTHFYIINYDSIFSEKNRLKDFLSLRNAAIVLDESQRIKNPNAKITSAIFDLKDYSKKRIIISGTPIANKPEDIWSQFYFLDPKILDVDFNTFKKKYEITFNDDQKFETKSEKLISLRCLINKVSIRRLKSDVLELPEKEYEDIYVDLNCEQQKIYDKLRDELIVEIKLFNDDQIIDESKNILKKLLRLTQVSSNPKLINSEYLEIPAKFSALDTILADIIECGDKAIVWTCFNGNIRSLKNRYQKYGSVILFGEIPVDERKKIVHKFQTEKEYKVMIANPSAAKEGLTLTSANYAIYIDRNFSLTDYLQSQDRIHRISQTKKCKIVKLLSRNTIDEYIDEILYKKQKISQFLQNDISSISEGEDFLTKSELLYILG